MKKNYRKENRILWVLFFLLSTVFSFGQNAIFKKGVRQGIVKVKFTDLSPSALKSISSSKGKRPLTGIQAFDKVSEKVGAKKMHRLFPENPNPRLEAKLKKHKLDMWYAVEIDANQDPQVVIQQYKTVAGLQAVEVEKEKVLSSYSFKTVTPSQNKRAAAPYFNDPKLGDQWHYENTGQTGFAGGADVNLFKAWDVVKGSPDVIVSIHDQGVDVKHPDLIDNIWNNKTEINGKPGVDDDNNGFVDDFYGWNFDRKNGSIDPEPHGTHVAGTVAAVNNNGIGVAGVAGGSGKNDGSKLMSVQCLGGGAIEETYIYAANNGAIVSQNSWGYTSPWVYEQVVLDAINYFIAEAGDFANSPMKGGIVIFASGNSHSDSRWYPAYYENTISVSATGPDWKKASYSNYGTWVDISAPGGETELGANNGVLSTLPKNQYGIFQGTSMACPHVSGIAALAIANRNSQLTPDALRKKLLTGVVDIDSHNPDYVGKLGVGHIDAYLAIQNNNFKAPNTITDLKLEGIAQEFANLSWTVPSDNDDVQPVAFKVLYSTAPINSSNMASASSIVIKNTAAPGASVNHTVNNLLGVTTYYFAVVAMDRWDNVSDVSNNAMGTTNQGPSIDVDQNSKSITLTVNPDNTFSASHNMDILNNAEGLLRWEFETRHRNTSLSFNSFNAIKYPKPEATKIASLGNVGKLAVKENSNSVTTNTSATTKATEAFKPIKKEYSDFPTNIIGEEDLKLSNSSAVKFIVTEEEGFNLTHIETYLRVNPDLGPVIFEVYNGAELNKKNLIAAKEYTPWDFSQHWAYVQLDEQLYFNKGEQFWIVVHTPAGNKYPLGIGWENTAVGSENCLISFDLGQSWGPLEVALNSKNFAFNTAAISRNKHLGKYLTLNPVKGEVKGNSTQTASLTADGSTLINGTYKANAILKSNDASKLELRIPVTVKVNGHLPVLSTIETLDFANVFVGTTKEMEFKVQNVGLGNFNNINLSISNPNFKLVDYAPYQIAAGEDVVIKVRYTPSASSIGNDNGVLKLTSEDNAVTANVILFGVSSEPTQIKVTPMTQLVDNVTIGETVTASIKVENTGKAALKYFIPKYDTTGISETWKGEVHKYGYKFRTNYSTESNPLEYKFEDITSTGTNITDYFKADAKRFYPLDMGFEFPYYENKMEKLYISHQGFTAFNDDVRPVNLPSLGGGDFAPKGYISPLGTYAYLSNGGSVHYKLESDRVIVQFTGITDGWSGELTAQMVLYADGNIRFFYDNIGYDQNSVKYLNVLIEDFDQKDGILIHDFYQPKEIYSRLAFGFDYPGPDIITSISNAGGILMPGESKQLDVVMKTENLNQALTNRYINIISNDPITKQIIPLVQLNVNKGGTGALAISDTNIEFGEVFKGASAKRTFSVKNTGTAPVTLTAVSTENDKFQIVGQTTATINPGLTMKFDLVMPTDVVASLTDVLHIKDNLGGDNMITLSGKVLDPPGILVTNLDQVIKDLKHGETAKEPIVFENNGVADLEVVATGNQWMTMSLPVAPNATIPNYTYDYISNNGGSNYQWIDIRKKGTQIPHVQDVLVLENYWENVKLPWKVNFYGKDYADINVGLGGILTFDEPTEIPFFERNFPSDKFKTLIAPYWSFAAFNTERFPKEEVGIFYYNDEEKFVISWEYLINFFGGMGDPVSAQVVFYKNGTMKFQYKLNGGTDMTSNSTIIGVQDSELSDFVKLPSNENIVLDNGLVNILNPAKKHVIPAGAKLNAQIDIDARNVYAGTHDGVLKIRSNVPNQELLEKMISINVSGDAEIKASHTELNFGEVMIAPTASVTKEFQIENTGSNDLMIQNIGFEKGGDEFTIETYMYMRSWFGGFWTWMNIKDLWGDYAPIKPGEVAQYRITLNPTTAGMIDNKILINSNATIASYSIDLKGEVTNPPLMAVQTKEISSVLKYLTDKDTQFATFDNILGQGDLKYEVSIDYLRKGISINTTAKETIVKSNFSTKTSATVGLYSMPATKGGISVMNVPTFNKVLAYEDKNEADNFLGYGGTKAFTSATRFNAGKEGFNMSHFQTYVEATKKPVGTVDYEIRAGSTDISKAVKIAEGTVAYDFKGSKTGQWLTLPIKEAIGLYPNEEFYVIITYPYEIPYVQGVLKGIENTPGRYMFENEGRWYDLQDESLFPGYGWMVRAAEEKHVPNAWVTLKGETKGVTPSGKEQKLELNFTAANGVRGDQHAVLNIRTNDPNNSIGQVPIKMHINEAPVFTSLPEKTIVAAENKVSTMTVGISDPENNPFTITSTDAPSWITFKVVGKEVQFTLAPGFEDAGSYTVNYTSKDDLGATSNMKITVDVTNTNRAPIVIQSDALTYAKLNDFDTRQFSKYFSDLDADAMTFSATMANNAIASVTTSQAQGTFVINTHNVGETTLMLKATDAFGASTEQPIVVKVVKNSAPVALETKSIVFNRISLTQSFDFNSYFNDADGDQLTFTASLSDPSIATLVSTSKGFTLESLANGEAQMILTATDKYGATADVMVTVVVNQTEVLELNIFPNPVVNTINIKWENRWMGDVNVEIVAFSGAIVRQFQVKDVQFLKYSEFDLSNLTPGVYFIKVSGSEGTSAVMKFIKRATE